uniref:anthocyanidin 3-O-glucosyltransferase 2-like n=1 Tax=Erigeron canadensis TaxID=72917 RepID=UPI001CB950AD|nr:anthocyanidin 3-O-glucosyltransferase 2-like [Erigeron canadensis]
MANRVAELVLIPAPVLGHIISIIEMAKVLVNRDQQVSIIVLVIKPPSGSKSGSSAITTYIESLANNERIRFIELPQDEILPNRDPKAPMTFVNDFINSHCKYVRKIVSEMISQTGCGRVAGFVIDMLCTGMMDVANEFNVPTYVFFTSNAAYLGFEHYIQTLCDDRNQDHVIELCNSDTEILIPSFSKAVPTKIFPSGFDTKEGLDYALLVSKKMKKAKAIMVNTFLELETHAIKSLSADTSIPRVYPVGPILNLEGGLGNLNNDVISWLDGQPSSSVVFLCFGSLGSFNEDQVKHIANALEQSGHRFVWSLRRPPLSEGASRAPSDYEDPGVVLPEGFLERTAGIGKVIGWAPQVDVLAHRAVGGFVSHCGWNSILESLWFGLPLATWPIYAEQQMNAFEMVVELGLAVEIKMDHKKDLFNQESDIVSAEEIVSGIKQLMENERVRHKMTEMGLVSRATVREGGSSYTSVGLLIQEFKSNIS